MELLGFRFCQLLRFCRGWCDIRVTSETGFVGRSCGRAPSEVLTELQVPEPFAQLITGRFWQRSQEAQEGKLGSAWGLGILMGRSIRTNEQLDGTRNCRAQCDDGEYAVLRHSNGTEGLYEGMIFVPWMVQLQDRKLAGETTPGCKACDEERSGVRTSCRPFNHTPDAR